MDVAEATAFALAEAPSAPAEDSIGWSVLTRRERDVAALVAGGLTNREVAAELVIAERTAEGHVENIHTKLGFHSRSQVAAWVAEQDEGDQAPRPGGT